MLINLTSLPTCVIFIKQYDDPRIKFGSILALLCIYGLD